MISLAGIEKRIFFGTFFAAAKKVQRFPLNLAKLPGIMIPMKFLYICRGRAMKYVKAFLIWLIILPLAIVNGGIRIYITEPLLGSNIALPLSGIILSALVFLMACLFIPKTGKCKPFEYLLIGVLWFVLTNLFDFLMTVLSGEPISDFFTMFDITTGNLWSVVVIVCLIAPLLAAKMRKLIT